MELGADKPITQSEVAATRSFVMNGVMRATCRSLLAQGLDAATISASLEIPIELIQSLEGGNSVATAQQEATSEQDSKDYITHAETKLRGLSDRAVNVISDLLDMSENEGVKLAAAKLVLEGSSGSLRTKGVNSGGNVVNNINLIVQQAQTRYQEQLRSAGLSQSTPAIDIPTK